MIRSIAMPADLARVDTRLILSRCSNRRQCGVPGTTTSRTHQAPKRSITYFVCGSGAQLRKGRSVPSDMTAAGFDQDQAFMLVEVDGDQLHFETVSRTGATVERRDSTDRRAHRNCSEDAIKAELLLDRPTGRNRAARRKRFPRLWHLPRISRRPAARRIHRAGLGQPGCRRDYRVVDATVFWSTTSPWCCSLRSSPKISPKPPHQEACCIRGGTRRCPCWHRWVSPPSLCSSSPFWFARSANRCSCAAGRRSLRSTSPRAISSRECLLQARAVAFFLLLAISARGLGFIALAVVVPIEERRLASAVPLMFAAVVATLALRELR